MTETVLVTGGNGFLALHIISQLLNQNYQVRTTLRTLDKQDQVRQALSANHVAHLDQLSFVAADLTQDAHWLDALNGVTTLFSVAAPVFVGATNATPDAVTNTAVEGTMRLIKFAEQAGVKRMVMTGNLGAVAFSNKDRQRVTTEADWTDPDQRGLSSYERSKLIAEKAAWDYLDQTHSALEFAVINPGAMLGPALDNHVSGSFDFLRYLLNPKSVITDMQINIVDVRDVAAMHVLAMQTPAAAGKRFIAVEDQTLSLPQIVSLIRRERPALAEKTAHRQVPGWLLGVAALFNQNARENRLMQTVNHNVSNQQAKQILGWQPVSSTQEAILSAVDTLVATHQI
ncbi:NAD-dependent epimerase/dehydratase family protein [Lacticaseibacillus saniviri]|uniref:NAD dependent epimerase dehydratase family protein n=1 Tax=Lacticaseibacillus saniviri JCM 17471 = DSM 24301 TaxID=1293598 RepID=A0A0R2MRB4_9LACO|nr:NAD-dependent epimerase/dehydratase family protein [Lacticaseibacillus saniviri]KRO16168.1 NAD dependent epimerase dehydratase family protein [Lacticaseibacillus saniviri JCM 17471 = DSM 24301]MCG4281280.1 NAD-dependent epimerase/dehydratase family protein [Lacticaseibacillus saniviri]